MNTEYYPGVYKDAKELKEIDSDKPFIAPGSTGTTLELKARRAWMRRRDSYCCGALVSAFYRCFLCVHVANALAAIRSGWHVSLVANALAAIRSGWHVSLLKAWPAPARMFTKWKSTCRDLRQRLKNALFERDAAKKESERLAGENATLSCQNLEFEAGKEEYELQAKKDRDHIMELHAECAEHMRAIEELEEQMSKRFASGGNHEGRVAELEQQVGELTGENRRLRHILYQGDCQPESGLPACLDFKRLECVIEDLTTADKNLRKQIKKLETKITAAKANPALWKQPVVLQDVIHRYFAETGNIDMEAAFYQFVEKNTPKSLKYLNEEPKRQCSEKQFLRDNLTASLKTIQEMQTHARVTNSSHLLSDDLEKELLDCVTREIMSNPCTLSDGSSMDLPSFEEWVGQFPIGSPVWHPITRQPIERMCVPNILAGRLIKILARHKTIKLAEEPEGAGDGAAEELA